MTGGTNETYISGVTGAVRVPSWPLEGQGHALAAGQRDTRRPGAAQRQRQRQWQRQWQRQRQRQRQWQWQLLSSCLPGSPCLLCCAHLLLPVQVTARDTVNISATSLKVQGQITSSAKNCEMPAWDPVPALGR